MNNLDSLNESQREAVLTTEGPVMVIAGAGSGKTRVLTHRIAYLISEGYAYPDEILAVTFTNKAAIEMRERVEKLINRSVKGLWISTFHSFCSRFLRIEIYNLNTYTSNFLIIDTVDAEAIVRRIIKDKEIENVLPKKALTYISNRKNFNNFEPFEEESVLKNLKLIEKEYNDYLLSNNSLDFDDLILKTLEILRDYPLIREKYQNRFKYILVDEFQDTNTHQYELIYLLTNRYQNVFIVGDQDQSIYSFRGAVIENINAFIHDYPLVKKIVLEQNYRSTPKILNIANNLIKKNSDRIEKNLFTDNIDVADPVYYYADTGYDEAYYVVNKIKALKSAYNYDYKDMAILYRNNYLSRGFEDVLIRENIPYRIYGGLSFYSRKEIKDIVAYLRLTINPHDNISFLRVVNEPKRKIGPKTISNYEIIAEKENVSLYTAVKNEGKNTSITKFCELLDVLSLKLEETNSLEDFIDVILSETGYKEMLLNNDEDDRLDNILEFKSVLKEVVEASDKSSIKEILADFLIDLSLRTDDLDAMNTNTVSLMTLHQAKGLEFKIVFLVALESQIFPRDVFNIKELAEDRRVCYVGITRAKERLFVTNAQSRMLFGRSTSNLPSIFINEMGINNNAPRINKTITQNTPVIETKSQAKITVGTKINHKAFGDGIVVTTNGNKITVAFDARFGIKTLISDHPSIRVIEKK